MQRNASGRAKQRAKVMPLALPNPPDLVRRAGEAATGYALRSFPCATHAHTKEDNDHGNPYTYPQPVPLQTGLHPGSKFNRRGGSKFNRRGQPMLWRVSVDRKGPRIVCATSVASRAAKVCVSERMCGAVRAGDFTPPKIEPLKARTISVA